MKKLENKIKNSIKIPNLSFFEKLPKIEKKNKYHYSLALTSILILFTILISNINVNKSLTDQVFDDHIIFNIFDTNNSTANDKLNISDINETTGIMTELMYSYISKSTTLEEVNEYYNINMSSNNLVSCTYTTYNNDENTILDFQLEYKKSDKSIIIRVADNFRTWNIRTGGLLNTLEKSAKSIINNKQIVLAKYQNNDYPVYYKFETIKKRDYYHALYKKDNLYYYITSSDIIEEEFISFLKEYII